MAAGINWDKQPYKTILKYAINKKAAIEILRFRKELQNYYV